MDIGNTLTSLASKIRDQRALIETEEATKNAFVMPFISQVLGYDVFNPHEVIPEYTTDVGTKRGEKIDYAIVHEGDIQVLIEVKSINSSLSLNHASQLFRYFATSNARVAILTNGQHYHFFTDLEKPNRMDERAFLQLDLLDLDESLIPEVQKLTKDSFNLDSIVSAAEELKYIGELKRTLATQFREPDDDWIKALTYRVYQGSVTQRVRDQFRVLAGKAMEQFLDDQANSRLKAALGNREHSAGPGPAMDASEPSDTDTNTNTATGEPKSSARRGVETTLEEIEGSQIVRAIACSEVAAARIVSRDTQSYMGVLLDDNNRKPIARLHFNTEQMYLGLLDEEKNETRHPISHVDEIYKHAEYIRKTVNRYL